MTCTRVVTQVCPSSAPWGESPCRMSFGGHRPQWEVQVCVSTFRLTVICRLMSLPVAYNVSANSIQ